MLFSTELRRHLAPRKGFEPSTSRFVAARSSCPLSYRGIYGLAGRIRTCVLVVPNDARGPLRYGEMALVETAGFKPASPLAFPAGLEPAYTA